MTLATTGPLVLAIDDVQWLDLPSARVLEFAIRRLHDVPIGILVTARAEENDPLPLGLDRALPAERIHRLLVGPITQAATRDLLNEELSTRLPRSVLLEIHGTAAGNPFLALELGRAILRRGIDREPGRFAAGAVDADRSGRRPARRALRSGQARAPAHGGRVATDRIADRAGDRGDGCGPRHRGRPRRGCDRGERRAHQADPPAARDRAVLGVVRTRAERRAPQARGGRDRPRGAGEAPRPRCGSAERRCRRCARGRVQTGERPRRARHRGEPGGSRSRADPGRQRRRTDPSDDPCGPVRVRGRRPRQGRERIWKRPSHRLPPDRCAPRRCCSSPVSATTATTPPRRSRSPNRPSTRSATTKS